MFKTWLERALRVGFLAKVAEVEELSKLVMSTDKVLPTSWRVITLLYVSAPRGWRKWKWGVGRGRWPDLFSSVLESPGRADLCIRVVNLEVHFAWVIRRPLTTPLLPSRDANVLRLKLRGWQIRTVRNYPCRRGQRTPKSSAAVIGSMLVMTSSLLLVWPLSSC